MLLALLVVAQAAAEWVEISQQHYRKPIRTHISFNPFTTPDKFEVEDTTKAWTYNNRSVTEYNWNKPTTRQPNTGNKRRVQFATSSVKPTELFRAENEYSALDKDESELRTQDSTKPVPEVSDNTKQKATITRVPNIGNIRRVQISNTPVKSPFLNKDDKEKVAKTRYEELPLENEQAEELFEHKRRTESKPNNRRIYVSQLKNQHSTESTSTFPIEDESSFTEDVMKKRPKQELKIHSNTKNKSATKPTFVTETDDDFTPTEKNVQNFYKVAKGTIPPIIEKKHIFTTEATDVDEDRTDNDEEILINNEKKPTQTIKQTHKTSDLIKHRPVNKFSPAELDRDSEEIVKNEQRKALKKTSNTEIIRERKPEKESSGNKKGVKDKEKKDPSKGNKPDSKLNNMENLMKLMKVVADTISQNTRRSFGGKMRYLHDLKDTILANIAERIDATWPDDDAPGGHRRSRAAHASPRGHHVHFPSSESALMTISFLTFAVFLIKLVLQVIQTYKNKTMMVAPVMVAAASRATHAHRGNYNH